MTTTTATLTAFLLARIAEDEARVRDSHADEPFAHLDLISRCDCDEDHLTDNFLVVAPARVLAECATHRAIVGWAMSEEGGPDEIVAEVLQDVLAHLASVYADHPDYREEWRS